MTMDRPWAEERVHSLLLNTCDEARKAVAINANLLQDTIGRISVQLIRFTLTSNVRGHVVCSKSVVDTSLLKAALFQH